MHRIWAYKEHLTGWYITIAAISLLNLLLFYSIAIASWIFLRNLRKLIKIRMEYAQLYHEICMNYSMYHKMKKESEKLRRTTRERVVHFDITTKTAKESEKWSQKTNREKIKGSNVTRVDSFGLNWDSLVDEDIEANLSNTIIRGPYNYQPNIPFWRKMKIEKGSIRTEFDLCSRNSSIHEPPSYIEDSESEASTAVISIVSESEASTLVSNV